MGKQIEKKDQLLFLVDKLNEKISILIALYAVQSKLTPEEKIMLFSKFNVGYDEIKNLLGVSSKTIAKVFKKKKNEKIQP